MIIKKSKRKKIDKTIINDGINAVSGVLSLVNPIFAAVPLFVFGINRVVNYVKTDDIIDRIRKIEKRLDENKIDINEFKEKLNNLNEHERYVVSNNLNNILLNCIPETIEIYISVFIDYIMSKESTFEEELFEIISSLNVSDLKVLKNIKHYMSSGTRKKYQKSIIRENYIKKLNEEVEINNEIAKKENKKIDTEKTHKIKYMEDIPKFYEKNERFGEYTIFWQDFAETLGLNADINISKLLLFDYYNSDYSNWTYMARSFIKLEQLGVLEMEVATTLGTINSLNIDRFHLTNYCLAILSYLD